MQHTLIDHARTCLLVLFLMAGTAAHGQDDQRDFRPNDNNAVKPPANPDAPDDLANDTEPDLSWLDNLSLRIDVGFDANVNQTLPRQAGTPATARRDDDDIAFRIQLDAGYRFRLDAQHVLSLTYQYYQTLHTNQDDVDLQGHTLGARHTWSLHRGLHVSFDGAFAHWLLSNESYLRQIRGGGDVFFHEVGDLWGRVAIHYSHDDYPFDTTQDAHTYVLSIAQVYYLADARSYLTAGYAFTRSLADDSRWTYSGHRIYAGMSIWFDPLNNVVANVSFSDQGYDGIDPVEMVDRDDQIFSVSIRYNRKLLRHVTVYIGVQWRDVDSNLNRQDYDSTSLTTGAVITF